MRKRIFLVITMSLILSGCLPKAFLSSSGSGGVAGQVGMFSQGRAVKGFPAIPLYPKSKILESYGANASYGLSATSKDELSKVVDFYNNSFTPLGWEFQLVQNSQTNFVFEVKNSIFQGVVIVNTAADGKKTAITMSVAPR